MVDVGERSYQPTDVDSNVAGVLESRSAFYGFLAGFYFSPLTQEQVDSLAQADLSAYEGLNPEFDSGIENVKKYLARRNTGTRQELAVDFTGAFCGTASYEGKVCVPYRSVFTSEEGLLMQEGYVEAYRAYKAEAVRKKAGMDWPEDHISIMFQFVSMMSDKAAVACRNGDKDEVLRLMEKTRSFLESQLDDWTEEFFDLARRIVKTRFYKGILSITRGYLEFDRQLVSDVISAVEG